MTCYLELLDLKTYLQETMKHLKVNSGAYLAQKATLKKVNEILEKAKKEMNLKDRE